MKKRVSPIVAIILLTGLAIAQSQTSSSTSGQQSSTTPAQPAQGQGQTGAASGAQGSPSGTQGAPSGTQGAASTTQTVMAPGPQTPGTYLPQPKSQEEAQAVQAAMGLTDPAQVEKAADDLATKFPQSEFRSILYENAMERYREQNNADKALDAGRKALAANPDSVTALSGIASVLSEKTRDTDLDKEERWAEATKAANHLLELGDNMKIPANPGTPPEQVNAFRDQAKGMAYIALGTIDMNRKNDAAAAENFKKAIATDKSLKDPVVYLRQSVVLDRLKQYQDALTSANKVVELAPAGSRAAELGKQEQQRLQKLAASGMANPAGGTTAGAPATAPSTQPSTAPATSPSPQPTTQASDPQK